MAPNMGKCRAPDCQAPLRWAVHSRTGKGIPLDPEPVENGNLVLDGETSDGRPTVHHLAKGEDPAGMPRYVTHFATCPARAGFRR